MERSGALSVCGCICVYYTYVLHVRSTWMYYIHATVSQTDWGWQGPLGPSDPTPAQVGPLRGGCREPCPGGPYRSPKKSRQPGQVFSHLPSKKVSTDVWMKPSVCVSLCTMPLVLSLGTTVNSLAPSSLHPSTTLHGAQHQEALTETTEICPLLHQFFY